MQAAPCMVTAMTYVSRGCEIDFRFGTAATMTIITASFFFLEDVHLTARNSRPNPQDSFGVPISSSLAICRMAQLGVRERSLLIQRFSTIVVKCTAPPSALHNHQFF